MLHLLQIEISPALADEIRKALERTGAREVLIEDLSRADDFGRAEAASLLAKLGDRAAIEPLIRALSDAAPKVRESAAGSLGILRATEAETALIERLEKDQAPDVRGAAAQALGGLKTAGAKAALQAAMTTEKDGFVKVLIEQALR
jgi:HEAT repeat protein